MMSKPAVAGPKRETAVSFDINTVAIKLPEFWTDNALVSFAQAEAQFAIRSLTNSVTKFY